MKSTVSTLALLLFTFSIQAQNSKKDYLFKLKTSFGDMTVLLYEETPLHKANFIELAKAGRYDSTYFHRVIEEFMIQGGDIFRKPNEQRANDDDRIPAEIVEGLFHKKGELAAARTNNPEKKSSSCQFYIIQGKVYSEEELKTDQNKLNRVFEELMMAGKIDSLRQQLIVLQKEKKIDKMNKLIARSKPLLEELSGEDLSKGMDPKIIEAYSTVGGVPHLDGEYTVFGRVVDGLEVIDKIGAVKTKPGDEPEERIYMTVEVIEMKKKKITKFYSYTYPEN
ncbi:MAG: peptidylprolyl isomerase [Cytophagales bacterium]|nr:peptidylprolyl isomerase [Cytophagales bacterium]